MTTLFRVIFFCLLTSSLLAQEYEFDHITLEDDLDESGIFSLHQDQKGFLWMGSCNGLMRYDGKNITTFKNDSLGNAILPSACIYSISEDKNGDLWLGTYLGIFFFDSSKEQVSYYKHQKKITGEQSQDIIWFVHADQNGHLWFIDFQKKLHRVNTKNGTLTSFDKQSAPLSFFQNYEVSVLHIALDAVPAFLEDAAGNIWIGSKESGLLRYISEQDRFIHYTYQDNQPEGISSNQVMNIFQDKDHTIWVGTRNGLNRWVANKDHFISYQNLYDKSGLEDKTAWVTLQDKQGFLWVAAKGGIGKFNPESGTFLSFPYHLGQGDSPSFLVPKHEGNDGSFWAMKWDVNSKSAVLCVLNRSTKKFTDYISQKENPKAVHSGIGFTELLADKSGILWIGSFREGVNKLDLSGKKFFTYQPQDGATRTFRPSSKEISSGNTDDITIRQDTNGVLWLLYDNDFSWIRLHCTDHQGNFWIANNRRPFDTNGLGVSQLDLTTQTYTTFFTKNDIQDIPCGSTVNAMMVDHSGMIWIGFWDYLTPAPAGLVRIDPNTFETTCYQPDLKNPNSLAYESIGDLWEDQEGNIWIAFLGADLPLQKLNPETGAFTTYGQGIKPTVWAIEEDREGQIWLGAMVDGLILFDPKTGSTLKSYQKKDGLPNSSVQDIVTDEQNNLWLRTEFGISKFNPTTEVFKNFTVKDGLLTNRANGNHLAFIGRDNNIFIATPNNNGQSDLIRFNPNDIRDNPYPPQICFTGFQLFNEEVEIGDKSPLKQSISTTRKMELAHNENSFTIEFAALHFNRPDDNKYAYKLEPFQKEWIFNNNQNTVSYTNLNPGSYIFKVKAANYDGVWNEDGIELAINIHHPWWQTWWAYGCYALLTIALFIGIRRYELRRLRSESEAKRLAELDQLKSRLYTNITHEFRTPLTVIQGMANQIEGNTETKEMILRNSKNLLYLVNQMLEMSRIESGKMKLQYTRQDIIPYLRYLTESFQSFAATKNIRLAFSADSEKLVMHYDAEKIQYIIANLMSNAIKFTPDAGQITILVSKDRHTDILNNQPFCKIRVNDNGVGITKEQLPYIFDRFYQGDDTHTRQAEGTGIGLALTKELVELQGGIISVKSNPDKQQGEVITEFTIVLPIVQHDASEFSAEQPYSTIHQPEAWGTADHKIMDSPTNEKPVDSELPLLLIIEDNVDVVKYIKTSLHKYYDIQVAYDGEAGINKALDIIPDIIISDVMMPKKDGYEVTRILKNDERTSHVPIILLTAKADMDSKIEGLQRGADAYLTKPFHQKELLTRLQKLIELRQKMQARYAIMAPLPNTKDIALQVEDAFLKKIRDTIEENLEDADFKIPYLCQKIGMSQSQLYRKIKALTNQSIATFIRSVRLQKGKVLLETTDLTVSEIAYGVGFTDPSYFSKTFSIMFGYSPSERR